MIRHATFGILPKFANVFFSYLLIDWFFFYFILLHLNCWESLIIIFSLLFLWGWPGHKLGLQVFHASSGWLEALYFFNFNFFFHFHHLTLNYLGIWFCIFFPFDKHSFFLVIVITFSFKIMCIYYRCFFYHIIKWNHLIGPNRAYDWSHFFFFSFFKTH
jgi:hypothetical protein